jgi:hypothetical protein
MIVFVPKQKPAEAESLLSAQASLVLVRRAYLDPSGNIVLHPAADAGRLP